MIIFYSELPGSIWEFSGLGSSLLESFAFRDLIIATEDWQLINITTKWQQKARAITET